MRPSSWLHVSWCIEGDAGIYAFLQTQILVYMVAEIWLPIKHVFPIYIFNSNLKSVKVNCHHTTNPSEQDTSFIFIVTPKKTTVEDLLSSSDFSFSWTSLLQPSHKRLTTATCFRDWTHTMQCSSVTGWMWMKCHLSHESVYSTKKLYPGGRAQPLPNFITTANSCSLVYPFINQTFHTMSP